MAVFQKAFILMKVKPGHEEDVIDSLMKIPDIKEVHVVPGVWDLLAVMNTQKEIALPSDEKLYRLVLHKIEKIKYIQDTNTMVSQFSRSR